MFDFINYTTIANYFNSIIKSYKAIIIGLIGGYLGTVIGLPLPWLLGSLGLNLCFAFTNFKKIISSQNSTDDCAKNHRNRRKNPQMNFIK